MKETEFGDMPLYKIQGFEFTLKQDLQLRLKDMLEEKVDEKYYLKKTNNLIFGETKVSWDNSGKGYGSQQDRAYYQDELCPTLSSCNNNGDKSQVVLVDKVICMGNVNPSGNGMNGKVFDSEGITPTLTTNKGEGIKINETICLNSKGGRNGIEGLQPSLQDRIYDENGIAVSVTTAFRPSILVREATKKGFKEAYDGDSVNLAYPESETRRGRVGEQVAQTLQCNDSMGVVEIPRIRKLTPKECFRLMGFDDEDFDKAALVNSNAQLYKQAGNSICVPVLENILKNLLK